MLFCLDVDDRSCFPNVNCFQGAEPFPITAMCEDDSVLDEVIAGECSVVMFCVVFPWCTVLQVHCEAPAQ